MMKPFIFNENKTVWLVNKPEKKIAGATVKPVEHKTNGVALIRFQEKRERFVWIHPDQIMFVVSADHYVKSLIQCEKQNNWMYRHCTIKDLIATLPSVSFVRLNKFYLLNRNHFSGINEKEKTLYMNGDFSIYVPHRISKFILDMIKK